MPRDEIDLHRKRVQHDFMLGGARNIVFVESQILTAAREPRELVLSLVNGLKQ